MTKVGEEEWVTVHIDVDLTMVAGSDPMVIADWVLDALQLAAELDFEAFRVTGSRSIDGTEPVLR